MVLFWFYGGRFFFSVFRPLTEFTSSSFVCLMTVLPFHRQVTLLLLLFKKKKKCSSQCQCWDPGRREAAPCYLILQTAQPLRHFLSLFSKVKLAYGKMGSGLLAQRVHPSQKEKMKIDDCLTEVQVSFLLL